MKNIQEADVIGAILWSDRGEMVDAENEASFVFWIRMSDDGVEGCNII